jgi:hypothetical protein
VWSVAIIIHLHGLSTSGFVADGFDTLVFWPVDPAPEQVELFAGEVVPRLGTASRA